MKTIKATVLTKRVVKSFWGKKKYMLGLLFPDILFNQSGENIKEMKVGFIAYESLKVGDSVSCPIKQNENGFTFDFSKPIEKI